MYIFFHAEYINTIKKGCVAHFTSVVPQGFSLKTISSISLYLLNYLEVKVKLLTQTSIWVVSHLSALVNSSVVRVVANFVHKFLNTVFSPFLPGFFIFKVIHEKSSFHPSPYDFLSIDI